MISRPKRRVPSSNAVGGGRLAQTSPAIAPSAVRPPVRTTSTRARAADHRRAHEDGVARGRRARAVGGELARVLLDRVRLAGEMASWTKKSRASSTRPSAGTRSPADSSTTSPCTTSATGTSSSRPSRTTRARRRPSRAASRRPARPGAPGRNRASPSDTSAITMSEPTSSPVAALRTLAPSRTSTSGFWKCVRYWIHRRRALVG